MIYKLIKVNGEVEKRKKMSFKEMQQFVGGYVEYVATEEGKVICNEEGRLKQLPPNMLMPKFVGNIIIEVKK